ncbi:hypothetical protein BST96_09695 [Oceanicoccus sagamiensis]|uniref:ABC transmembrane type-1 domain-containing protein n=2 Tax=Oceanicoccus sagamiensis TaxID=716816 RepID=A0A1X9N8J0_9GAMM|nr:hypothetical protein BST96_09695 [Oceanicoccus sagamiensis]
MQSRLLLISLAVTLLSLALPIALLQVYDRILPNQGVGTAWVLGLGVLTAMLLEAGLRYGRSWMVNRAGMKFDAQSSVEAMQQLLSVPDAELKGLGHTQIEEGFNALKQLREYHSGQALLALYDAPFILLFLILIAYVGGAVVLIPITMLALAFMVVYWLGREASVHADRVKARNERRSYLLRQVFSRILPYKGLALEGVIASRFETSQRELASDQAQLDERLMQIQLLTSVFSQATTVIVVMFSAHLVISGDMSSGALAACTLLAGRCMAPVGALFSFWGRHQSSQQAFDKAQSLLSFGDSEIAVTDTKTEALVGVSCQQVTLPGLAQNLSFDLAAGKLARLEPDASINWSAVMAWLRVGGDREGISGERVFDGASDAAQIHIALVSRRSRLFQGSVLDNLTLFNSSRESLAYQWAEQLGLHQRLIQLPQGYHTQLAQGIGAGVDTGTAQLIALVRALTSEPNILLLDCADAGLDIAAQKQLAVVLNNLQGKLSCLVVSNSQELADIPLCAVKRGEQS